MFSGHGRSHRAALMPSGQSPSMVRVSLVRAAAFLLLWIVLCGTSPADLPVGIITAAIATWASLRLLPAGSLHLRGLAAIRLIPRFLHQSVVAGMDVARRAFDPRLPLRPGFVAYEVGLAPGPPRNVFATLTSLLPGTVPTGDEGGRLIYHCLDIDQPIETQLAAEEAALSRVLGHD